MGQSNSTNIKSPIKEVVTIIEEPANEPEFKEPNHFMLAFFKGVEIPTNNAEISERCIGLYKITYTPKYARKTLEIFPDSTKALMSYTQLYPATFAFIDMLKSTQELCESFNVTYFACITQKNTVECNEGTIEYIPISELTKLDKRSKSIDGDCMTRINTIKDLVELLTNVKRIGEFNVVSNHNNERDLTESFVKT